MKITYIEHSCFLIETDKYNILFDYFKGKLPPTDKQKPMLVFSTHSHHDHYNPEIFTILQEHNDVHYFFSEDIQKFAMPENKDIQFLSPCRTYDTSFQFTITTFYSTDLGTAFLLKSPSFCIYHAGDLNDWLWDDDTDDKHKIYANPQHRKEVRDFYRVEISKMKNIAVNVAFIPLDPRLKKYYSYGMKDFMEIVGADYIFPMHFWGQPEIIDKFINEYPALCQKNRVCSLKKNGEYRIINEQSINE